MQGFCVDALHPYSLLFFCLVKMWDITKLYPLQYCFFVCSELSKTEKQNIGLLPVSSVHQDLWCRCEDEGCQVLPGQGAGPGL